VVEAGEGKPETEGLGWVDGVLSVVFRLVMNIHGLIQVRWWWKCTSLRCRRRIHATRCVTLRLL